MRRETQQNLLHRFLPEWDASILKARKQLGFSFDLGEQRRWEWFAEGKHAQVKQCAQERVRALDLPAELAMYWICCFYSDYHKPERAPDLAAVKGPPFLKMGCPSSFLGKGWMASIEKMRSELASKHGLKGDGDFVIWFSSMESASQLGVLALAEVKNLGLPATYAMAWVCCFLPDGAKWMANRAAPVLESFPQFADWRQFICTGQHEQIRVRAYPFVIDWSEGADKKYRQSITMWDLQERGIDFGWQADPSENVRMSLTWRPELVRVDELRKAVEYAQNYYHQRLEPQQKTAPLHSLVQQFVHRAKVIPSDQRKRSAQLRYQLGEVTFEQVLCEEALTPEVQKEYQQHLSLYQESPARGSSALRQIRRLRKQVYDRVRSWLVEEGSLPKVQQHPPWWSEVLPRP